MIFHYAAINCTFRDHRVTDFTLGVNHVPDRLQTHGNGSCVRRMLRGQGGLGKRTRHGYSKEQKPPDLHWYSPFPGILSVMALYHSSCPEKANEKGKLVQTPSTVRLELGNDSA